MQTRMTRPRRVAVAAHPSLPDALAEAEQVCDYFNQAGIETIKGESLHDADLQRMAADGALDALLALGGDGTMLRAGRLCAPLGVPVLGINVGRFGFLAEVQRGEWQELLPRFLAGDFWLEERMLLDVEHRRAQKTLGKWTALNEAVVCRGRFVRPLTLHAFVDGYRLASYVADGLIAATPTGSTAYALAAGGPILPPELRNILIIPVAPHLSVDRAIILPQGAAVTIRADTTYEAALSVDGQPPEGVLDGDEVSVTVADFTASFIRFQDPGYFYHNITRYMEQNPVTGIENGR
ncbi:MAG: NAD(+)/NADH kinase [Anaerolineae bacterium]|nr:NAD(+)/NADH kinase [Anaerolineae bacterium]